MEEKSEIFEHYAVLDGLRGFAAIAVVLFHLGIGLHAPVPGRNGYLAVDFFFCLSGYVLALTYGAHRRQGLALANFIRFRLIRLAPLMVLGTVISVFLTGLRFIISDQVNLLPGLGLAFLLGLLNIPYLNAPALLGGPEIFPLNGPQYTLFFELVVNFLWFPIRARSPLIIAIAVAVICGAMMVAFGFGGDTTGTFWLGFPRTGTSFFAGIALFELQRRYRIAQKIRLLFWPLFVVMIVLFCKTQNIGFTLQLVWIMIISPLLVLTGPAIRASGMMKPVCLAAGAISYPIYVLQYPIIYTVRAVFSVVAHHRQPVLELPLMFVSICVFSIAAASFDRHIRKKLLNRRPDVLLT